MPSGPRIRENNVFGTVGTALTSGGTTLSSAGLANLPVVSAAHAIIVIDPLRTAGAPEIVVVTSHSGAATSATVTRGAYGTTARAHAVGVLWIHAPTIDDAIRILTSSTRPSDPYEGQLIYETDTDRYVGYDGSAWTTVAQLGAWNSWTPTLTNLTLGNGTQSAAHHRIGRTIHFRWKFTLGSTSAVGTSPQFTLPVAAHADYAINMPMGTASLLDSGVALYLGWGIMINASTVAPVAVNSAGATATNASVTATVPFTWATGDVIMVTGTYEAAS